MKNFVVYEIQTGEIVKYGFCQDNDFQNQAEDNCAVVEGYGSQSSHFVKDGVIIQYTSEQIVQKSKRPFYPASWSNETFSWVDERTQEEQRIELANVIKNKRGDLLYESDWTQLPNNPLTAQKQEEWAVYRQQLRDITNQPGYPFNVIWPTKPE